MNKKLRLLVTAKCHNKCPMCCNNQFDFEKIPVVDRLDYDEISITGGEPLLAECGCKTFDFVDSIKNIQQAMGLPESKFYLYTSYFGGVSLKKFAAISLMESALPLTRRRILISSLILMPRCLS